MAKPSQPKPLVKSAGIRGVYAITCVRQARDGLRRVSRLLVEITGTSLRDAETRRPITILRRHEPLAGWGELDSPEAFELRTEDTPDIALVPVSVITFLQTHGIAVHPPEPEG